MVPALLAIALAGAVQQPATVLTCAKFESPAKLAAGVGFRAPLPNGFEFRLSNDWAISVVPTGDHVDYLWLVSPPLRTAPHRYLRPSYGESATTAAKIERGLRFVLNRADYDAALASHGWDDAGKALKRMADLGRGVLNIYVDTFELDGDKFRWISFHGEGCVPR